jgi:hypothetical protein
MGQNNLDLTVKRVARGDEIYIFLTGSSAQKKSYVGYIR